MAVTILPGIDESLGPKIKALGETIYQKTGLAKRRAIESSLLRDPTLAQKFADLEYQTPGMLEKLGFGEAGEYIKGISPSAQLVIDRATREDLVPTAIATSKATRGKAEFQQSAIETLQSTATDEQRIQAGAALAGAPKVSETQEELAKAAPVTGANIEDIAQTIVTRGVEGLASGAVRVYRSDPGIRALVDKRVEVLMKEQEGIEQNRAELVGNINGAALTIANQLAEAIDFPTPQMVLQELQQQFPELAANPNTAGFLGTAAQQAVISVMSLGPRTQEERRLAGFYVRAAPAGDIIRNLSNGIGTKEGQPVKWNTKMDLASSLLRTAAGVDSGIGFGDAESTRRGTGTTDTERNTRVLTKGGKKTLTTALDEAISTLTTTTSTSVGTAAGKVGQVTSLIGKLTSLRAHLNTSGDVTSEDIPSALLTQAAQALMNEDEQRFFTATLRYIEGTLRKDTGFRIEKKEFQDRVNQSIPREIEEPGSINDKEAQRGYEIEQLRLDAKLRPGYINELQRKIDRNTARGLTNVPSAQPTPLAGPSFDSLLGKNSDTTVADSVNTILKENDGDSRKGFAALIGKIGSMASNADKIPNYMFMKTLKVLQSLAPVDESIDAVKADKGLVHAKTYIDSLNKRKTQIINETTTGKVRDPEAEARIQRLYRLIISSQDDTARLNHLRIMKVGGVPEAELKEVLKMLGMDPKKYDEF